VTGDLGRERIRELEKKRAAERANMRLAPSGNG
jgi:hypothetical protein